ncbi:MAG: hypothetical protein HY217_07370 [Candidatus Rokubacteria bacterium]|nr:hypothetical protein [Candidatus Rokubacteria bacterium]
MGIKAERPFGPRFFWVLAGMPLPKSAAPFEYFIIPAADMARNVSSFHKRWLAAPGMHGRQHKDSRVRAVNVPPNNYSHLWTIEEYRARWERIAEQLRPRTTRSSGPGLAMLAPSAERERSADKSQRSQLDPV